VAILALFFKDRSALRPVPLAGMAIGFLGVGIIIGIDSIVGDTSAIWIGAVVLAALGYASAAIMANRKLGEVPIAGTIGLSMLIVSLVYSIPASSFIPKEIASNPPLESWLAILALGVVCSALAFVIFFRLLREVGAVKATLITYVNTAVAILLGTVFLSEPITPGLIAGIPLIAIGLYLSTKSPGIKKMPRRFASYEDSSS
jgi:drug/metabolite transporter (DMT)-like permease